MCTLYIYSTHSKIIHYYYGNFTIRNHFYSWADLMQFSIHNLFKMLQFPIEMDFLDYLQRRFSCIAIIALQLSNDIIRNHLIKWTPSSFYHLKVYDWQKIRNSWSFLIGCPMIVFRNKPWEQFFFFILSFK